MAPFGVLIAASAAKAVLADIRNSQFGEEIWRVPKQLIVLFSSFDLFEIVGKFWLSRWRQLSLGAPWELLPVGDPTGSRVLMASHGDAGC